MIDKKLGYSKKTQELIERQCRNVERSDFELDKKKAEELALKTFDLFKLDRPRKIKWCTDIFDTDFEKSARSARSAWSAGSAGSARSARSARSAWSAWSAGSARSARSAWSAGSAGSARSARSARSAWSAGSAGSAGYAWSAGYAGSWTALDYDFDWYIFVFEYCQNPDEKKPTKDDKIYLEYCELLMQAKEAGLGYWVEWEDTLYLVQTPIVRIDSQNRFHSLTEPAIRWKDGKGFYYLHGIKFKKDQWQKAKSADIGEILSWTDIDQRSAILQDRPISELLEKVEKKLIDHSDECGGYDLYEIELKDIGKARILSYKGWSSEKPYAKFVPLDSEKALDTVAKLRHQSVDELRNSIKS